MQLTINLDKLLMYAHTQWGRPGEFQSMQITPLAVGVYRFDLSARLAPDHLETLAFVHKYTYRSREIRALQALNEICLPGACHG